HVVAQLWIAERSHLQLVFEFRRQLTAGVQIDEFSIKFVAQDILSIALPSLSLRALRPRYSLDLRAGTLIWSTAAASLALSSSRSHSTSGSLYSIGRSSSAW